jgi:carbamoyltransferase
MTSILGISAFYHDAAACLLVDGRIVAAAQEERFTRRKHDPELPQRAIASCLEQAGLDPADVDYVAFYDKPLLKFERLLETFLGVAPRGYRLFLEAMPDWMHRKLFLPSEIRRGLGGRTRRRIVFAEHHESHAASAFFPSPFEEAAILTADGVGEWATASIGVGHGHQLHLLEQLDYPHSPGLLYSAFTYHCGFKVNSGEYKLMGLAPFGEPRYVDRIHEQLLDLTEDGSFRLRLDAFNFCQGLTMTSKRFNRIFDGPPRRPESPITQREADMAASIQQVIEEIMLRMARHAHERTGQRNLCMAGGVALNCVANGRLFREGPFENIWIQPAAGDAGGALGVAWFVWHQLLGRPREADGLHDRQQASLIGPAFSDAEVEVALAGSGGVSERIDDETELCDRVAALLDQEQVVGWFQGRMEFGPRALGSRSILGDPRSPAMQSLMNRKIKFRESFRPFAPAVLKRRVHEFFDVPAGFESPYMLMVADVREAGEPATVETAVSHEGVPDLLARLQRRGGCMPAVTHVDGSARIQTVDERHGRFCRLLEAFEKRSGLPVLINTSFNIRGEPIVCTPEDAYRCFMATGIDALVIENHLLLKSQQPVMPRATIDDYVSAFDLD